MLAYICLVYSTVQHFQAFYGHHYYKVYLIELEPTFAPQKHLG